MKLRELSGEPGRDPDYIAAEQELKPLIVDTFAAFLRYWHGYQDRPLDEQIEAWAQVYLSPWPDLLALQVEDYAAQGADWREIARERVFPFLGRRLPAMCEAHQNLAARIAPVIDRAQQVLHLDLDPTFVLYVGIGCGAGWVTPFRGSPAVLFGLENVAECGWSGAETIEGLVAHEVGHLAHHHWRAQHGKAIGSGPWWQLYEEGFAQRNEHRILGAETWHQASRDGGWPAWCRAHRAWLAAEFLRAVQGEAPVSRFFGSWFDIDGHSETGYYLGCEAIRELEKHLSLREIALLDEIPARVRPILERMATDI